MEKLSCGWTIALITLFLIFLIRAYNDDKNDKTYKESGLDTTTRFHTGVVNTMLYENKHGVFAQSKVKRMIHNSRDQVIRGILMGAVTGSAGAALHNAVTWSLIGGIVNGCSDLINSYA